jgi:hypothetical protein
MDGGLLNRVLFLELKKAFDTVDHHRSLNYTVLEGIALNGSIHTLKVETKSAL